MNTTLSIGLLVFPLSAMADQLYKCTENGVTVYSQVQCDEHVTIDIPVDRVTQEQAMQNDIRVLEENYKLELEKMRRYQLWAQGKYWGGDHRYEMQQTWDYGPSPSYSSGQPRFYPPKRQSESRPPPQEPVRRGGAATISGNR